jgi:hypothetical protein
MAAVTGSVSMKPTKQILNLLKQRQLAGERLNSLDCMVVDWFDSHKILYQNTETGEFLVNSIMLITEPKILTRLSIEAIEKQEQ